MLGDGGKRSSSTQGQRYIIAVAAGVRDGGQSPLPKIHAGTLCKSGEWRGDGIVGLVVDKGPHRTLGNSGLSCRNLKGGKVDAAAGDHQTADGFCILDKADEGRASIHLQALGEGELGRRSEYGSCRGQLYWRSQSPGTGEVAFDHHRTDRGEGADKHAITGNGQTGSRTQGQIVDGLGSAHAKAEIQRGFRIGGDGEIVTGHLAIDDHGADAKDSQITKKSRLRTGC